MLAQRRTEQKRGWWEAEAPLGDTVARFNNEFCLLLYFGVTQGSKVRDCVDPAELATMSKLLETSIISVLPEVRASWGPIDLLFFKEDWEAALSTLDLKQDDRDSSLQPRRMRRDRSCALFRGSYYLDRPAARLSFPEFPKLSSESSW